MTNIDLKDILKDFADKLNDYYESENPPDLWYPMFYKLKPPKLKKWQIENYERFLEGTRNGPLYSRWHFKEMGAITALEYSKGGTYLVSAHDSGLIQLRHGITGIVLCTLRNIQFPPKPVYALQFSPVEERVCYAACMDGAVYRIEIPNIPAPENVPEYCIKVDPALGCLTTQYYGAPGISSYSTPFITQRYPALSFGVMADNSKMAVGYSDSSIKIYEMETQQAVTTYKIHKLRLPFIPKKLQRIHFGQVCALRAHPTNPTVFGTSSWDKTLRIWDTRCKVGCMMTFEGVDICSDSIDLNRDQCIAGSWRPTEALSVWDLTAKKQQCIVRVQNRRPDVDGEYIYACRYWKSSDYNRKGKYAIIGGSGTGSVEVINLHNRYITCSYPAHGIITAVSSYQDRIAYGGTSPLLSIVSFHDPKHEKYEGEVEPDIDYRKAEDLFEDEGSGFSSDRPGDDV